LDTAPPHQSVNATAFWFGGVEGQEAGQPPELVSTLRILCRFEAFVMNRFGDSFFPIYACRHATRSFLNGFKENESSFQGNIAVVQALMLINGSDIEPRE
jgi:hypothetical protein